MREDSCLRCLFSENDEMTTMLSDLPGLNRETMRCCHPSSPYYEELVYEDISCRQFVDAQEYFKMKDRAEYIEEIKNKIKGRK